ncbi:MAG: hypothetical protein OJJ54_04995 [Pseudonocardia sp.]|nr:hypothetical protein [Pseudonocardia sp.]
MTSAQSTRSANPFTWFARGGWYFAVVLLTAGMFSPVPFAHAATRLRTPLAWLWPVLYTAAVVTLLVLLPPGEAPPSARGDVVGGLLVGLLLASLVHLTVLRRQVWPRDGRPRPAAASAHDDPAVVAALAARIRRAESRTIAATDPLLARELRIGRPDLPRTYDDGGLVDLNSAPAQIIAHTCGIPVDAAQRIVTARVAGGVLFVRVEDAFTWTDVPVELWDRIRDRGVVY